MENKEEQIIKKHKRKMKHKKEKRATNHDDSI